MRNKLDDLAETTNKVKEKLKGSVDKDKAMDEEDVIPKYDPLLQEEPFLATNKASGRKYIEGIHLLSGKIDLELVMEWIEEMENHFLVWRSLWGLEIKSRKIKIDGNYSQLMKIYLIKRRKGRKEANS